MDKSNLDKYDTLYESIDELLGETVPQRKLGRAALAGEVGSAAMGRTDSDSRFDTMAIKIGNMSAGLFPYLPEVA